jgi:hypothetical protein
MAARYGRTFGRVDRFFPSTRMCSDCGRVTDKMALNVRTWTCPCGSHHDRDVNAAKNVKAAGQVDFNDRGARVRPGLVPAPRGEAVTHPDAACSTRSVEGISVLRAERMSMCQPHQHRADEASGEKVQQGLRRGGQAVDNSVGEDRPPLANQVPVGGFESRIAGEAVQ